MTVKRPPSDHPSTLQARAALEHGAFIRHNVIPDRWNGHYRYGRRLFSGATVNKIVALGHAVRDGDVVRIARNHD